MRTNWIVTKSNSDNAEVEFYRFYGSSDRSKRKREIVVNGTE